MKNPAAWVNRDAYRRRERVVEALARLLEDSS